MGLMTAGLLSATISGKSIHNLLSEMRTGEIATFTIVFLQQNMALDQGRTIPNKD